MQWILNAWNAIFRSRRMTKGTLPVRLDSASTRLMNAAELWNNCVPNETLWEILQLPDCTMDCAMGCIQVAEDQYNLIGWIAWQGWYQMLREWHMRETTIELSDAPQNGEKAHVIIPQEFLEICRQTLDEHDANKTSIVAYCEDQLDWTMARKYVQKWGMTSSAAVQLLALLYMHGQISLQPQAVDAPEDLVTS